METFSKRFDTEMLRRESESEKFSTIIWMFVIALTYAVFLTQKHSLEPLLVNYITGLVAVMLPCFICVFLIIHFGRYHPLLTFINSFLQISLVSGAIFFDTLVYGANYALSSMPPLAYALVIVVTAFRLRPSMGLFSGSIAAVQFIFLYVFMRHVDSSLTSEKISQIPSLDWSVTIMKIVILMAMGIACSFTAIRLKKELYRFVSSAELEMQMQRSLGRYVSRDILAQIKDDNEKIISSRISDVVVMFGDIRNFTQFSGHHSPEIVAEFLNQYFDRVNEVIERHGGFINKFLGDGFLAVFGLFDKKTDPIRTSTEASLEILAKTRQYLGDQNLGMGLGLNYGPVIAGEIGSSGRCEYTVIGDTVNIASRIESLNRQLGTEILVSGSFAARLEGNKYQKKDMGEHRIRGVSEPVNVLSIEMSVNQN